MKSTRVMILALFAAVVLVCATEATGDTNCNKPCTFDYSPLCGRKEDGTTREFGNQCDYENYNCAHPGEYTTTTKGRCS